jgi:hypothetical protein
VTSTELHEIKDIPITQRKLRIFINAIESSELKIIWAGSESYHKINPGKHTPVIVKHGNDENHLLSIECISGKCEVGNIDINHSWKVNEYYQKKYPDQTEILLKSNCDLSNVSGNFLEDLEEHIFFQSTGVNDYSAITQLKTNVKINNIPKKNDDWIGLSPKQTLSIEIYVPPPAGIRTCEEIGNHKVKVVNTYNKSFIDSLDKRFYEYIPKKLSNFDIAWNENLFTGYKMPYATAIRIQSQLVDNIEFIKNRHVIDLGPYRGDFLYPCVKLGCASVVGVQPMENHNVAINLALNNLGHNEVAKAIWGDAYDLHELINLCKGKDTLLVLGLIYHLNNHYQFFETITRSDITALVIDTSVSHDGHNHLTNSEPNIRYWLERQDVDTTGWELNGVDKEWTWVGSPNLSWLTNTLKHMGWKIKSTTLTKSLRLLTPQLMYRGVVTAYR